MVRRFEVSPPRKSALIAGAILTILLPFGLICGVLVHIVTTASPDSLAQDLPWLILALLVSLAVGVSVVLLARRQRVELEHGCLRVRAAVYGLDLPVSALDLVRAQIVDLRTHPHWRPGWRSNGFGMPGLQAGHFRGRPLSQKLFCLVTRPDAVLALPEHGGRVVLLSLERPQDLLDALREAAARTGAG